jgi:hypothetical protein
MNDDQLIQRSEAYLDGLFGPGAGRRHTQFLEHLESAALRETMHRYHLIEADTTHLSVEENYLLGMCVLCATKSYSTAGMFAKTLLHLGVRKEKILAAITRLSMWIGGIPAAEAAAHMQRAIHDYEQHGLASLEAWFPPLRSEAARG